MGSGIYTLTEVVLVAYVEERRKAYGILTTLRNTAVNAGQNWKWGKKMTLNKLRQHYSYVKRCKLISYTPEMLTLRKEVEAYIDGVEDNFIQQILRHRYLLGYSWERISRQYGRCGGTGDCYRKIAERYIEKNSAECVEIPCRCGKCKFFHHGICDHYIMAHENAGEDDFCSYGRQR